MLAVICTRYGPPEVLQLAQVPRPVPRDNEALIRVHATTCHIGDVRVRGAILPLWMQLPFRLYMGFQKPKRPILGMELSGMVEAVGPSVQRFRTGDAVVAFAGYGLGAHAEYICLPADSGDVRKGLMVPKPQSLSHAQAAAGLASGALTALNMLRKADIRAGHKVLVHGASGSVGVYATQLARHFGAAVTGVCSTRNVDMVRSLGAVAVLDYTRNELESCRDVFDVVFDAVGKLHPALARRLTAPSGRRLDVRRHVGPAASMTTAELQFLADLSGKGELRTFIDREYPLERMAEAHEYVQQGHKRGHVVINVS